MAETKKLSGAGLRGQSAGQTALCTVGKSGTGLTYRGYDISELAEGATFEEVAYLILYGELPNQKQLSAYKAKLKSLRGLPKTLKDLLERIPKADAPDGRDAHGLFDSREPRARGRLQRTARRGGSIARDTAVDHQLLVSLQPRWNANRDGDRRRFAGRTFPASMLLGKRPSELQQRVMDVSLILYAEHEFNASTFTARVCASTLSDMHSCVTGAIGSLRGPLHGGANEAAMEMIEKFDSPAAATTGIKGMLARKDKIMGFGHAIYATSDPRNAIIKKWAEKLSKDVGDKVLYPGLGRCRNGDVGRKEVVRQRGLLSRVRVPLHGHPDEAVYADLRLFACVRMDRARHGTALQQPHHPAQRGLCGSGAAPLR